eukprot:10510_6
MSDCPSYHFSVPGLHAQSRICMHWNFVKTQGHLKHALRVDFIQPQIWLSDLHNFVNALDFILDIPTALEETKRLRHPSYSVYLNDNTLSKPFSTKRKMYFFPFLLSEERMYFYCVLIS